MLKPYDGTLNTVGHVCYNEFDYVEPDQPDSCGHGFSGAEDFPIHLPSTRRHSGAE